MGPKRTWSTRGPLGGGLHEDWREERLAKEVPRKGAAQVARWPTRLSRGLAAAGSDLGPQGEGRRRRIVSGGREPCWHSCRSLSYPWVEGLKGEMGPIRSQGGKGSSRLHSSQAREDLGEGVGVVATAPTVSGGQLTRGRWPTT